MITKETGTRGQGRRGHFQHMRALLVKAVFYSFAAVVFAAICGAPALFILTSGGNHPGSFQGTVLRRRQPYGQQQ